MATTGRCRASRGSFFCDDLTINNSVVNNGVPSTVSGNLAVVGNVTVSGWTRGSVASYTTTGTTSGSPLSAQYNHVANGSTTVTHYLPNAATVGAGATVYVFRDDEGAGDIAIKSAGGLIDDLAAATGFTVPISHRLLYGFESDGTNWHTFLKSLPREGLTGNIDTTEPRLIRVVNGLIVDADSP